jgi:hypothetical protein
VLSRGEVAKAGLGKDMDADGVRGFLTVLPSRDGALRPR